MPAKVGDIVSVELTLVPENGYVPDPLFDCCGEVCFTLGWGNYLPGLHMLIEGMDAGDSISNVPIDAGWGKRNNELIVTVSKEKLKSLKDKTLLKAGVYLNLEGNIKALVTDVTNDTVTVDANPPLAGSSYNCDLTLKKIEKMPHERMEYQPGSRCDGGLAAFEIATFALGCYWGAQLAFDRVPGVVGTKAGFTQGLVENPSYEQVCQGDTQHREAVMVVYNPKVVSYKELIDVALNRLDKTTDTFSLHAMFDEDASEQYRYGFYFHTDEQKTEAETVIKDGCRFDIEVMSAKTFYPAEESHQHYLFKGGQSVRKGSTDPIRCYG
mmetsp:Transcript_26110/g.39510  ORF Transcript_26110/g.39510 Transcript_26110/m.39510 type:complete len:325 (-) Transcript_26110:485-1459(-)